MSGFEQTFHSGHHMPSGLRNLPAELYAFTFESAKKKMNQQIYTIRNAIPAEHPIIGSFMGEVYSQLEGFPKEAEQPNYYKMLANIGELSNKPGTELLVAVSLLEH